MKLRTIDGYAAPETLFGFDDWTKAERRQAIEAHNHFMDTLYPLPPKGVSKWESAIHAAGQPGYWVYLKTPQESCEVAIERGGFSVAFARGPGCSGSAWFPTTEAIYARVHEIEKQGAATKSNETRDYLARSYHSYSAALEKARALELRAENQHKSED